MRIKLTHAVKGLQKCFCMAQSRTSELNKPQKYGGVHHQISNRFLPSFIAAFVDFDYSWTSLQENSALLLQFHSQC